MDIGELKQKQSLPLEAKVLMTERRIRDWYSSYQGQVYISFSGGKDSTVLLHLVRNLYPEVEAVFIDTGLEYPEIREFVKRFANITILRPKMVFTDVLAKYGYPAVSKKIARMMRDLQNPSVQNAATRKVYLEGKGPWTLPKKWKYLVDAPFKISDRCCEVMKKEPINRYNRASKKKAFVGMMATDSRQRQAAYLQTGCFNHKKGICTPIAFWTEQDIWAYIKQHHISYCSIYDTGIDRTGCMFCMFGVHLQKRPNRFELMKKTHPELYQYCIKNLGMGKVLDYLKIEYGNQETLA